MPLPLEFNRLLQIRYNVGDQITDLMSCLDSALLAMNFLTTHLYFVIRIEFVICYTHGICNTAEYIECRILQSVFEKTIAVAK